MDPRRGRPSLAERGVLPSAVPAVRRAAAAPAGRPRGEAYRHCWVLDPPGAPGRWAGLLVEWRRADGGWQGLVSFVATLGDRPALLQAWVDAGCLRAR